MAEEEEQVVKKTRTDSNALPYPLTKMNFLVTFSELTGTMAFSEISGVDATVEVMEYRMGNASRLTFNKEPAFVRHGNVTMKYGLVTGTAVRDWIKNQILETGKEIKKQDITIELFDVINVDSPGTTQTTMDPGLGKTWTLKDAFIVGYRGADLNAMSSEVAIETIEIAYEELVIDNSEMLKC